MTDFNTIWQSITDCEGQTFATPGGQPFAYVVIGNSLFLSQRDVCAEETALFLK